MELRYLTPLYGFLGDKTGKYGDENRGLLLQFKNKDGEWENIKEVTEVIDD